MKKISTLIEGRMKEGYREFSLSVINRPEKTPLKANFV
jgi:hypothetical protein